MTCYFSPAWSSPHWTWLQPPLPPPSCHPSSHIPYFLGHQPRGWSVDMHIPHACDEWQQKPCLRIWGGCGGQKITFPTFARRGEFWTWCPCSSPKMQVSCSSCVLPLGQSPQVPLSCCILNQRLCGSSLWDVRGEGCSAGQGSCPSAHHCSPTASPCSPSTPAASGQTIPTACCCSWL